jgi:NAD(P)-dependent dehydrogenase (short-subunit alcohol dehydrogenase family)
LPRDRAPAPQSAAPWQRTRGGVLRLDGTHALIVGTGPAIGQAVARTIAGAGAAVTLVARRADAVRELAAAIERDGGTARALPADIDDAAARVELVRAAGPIDLLFYNAYAIDAGGISTWDLASPLDASEADWEACFRTNMLAPFALAKALVPGMIARGRGCVIHCLAAAAYTPILPAMAYGATKAGLAAMTTYLARTCAPAVRVNAIAPSNIEVPTRPEALRAAALNLPMQRLGLPEEVADAALFLASEAASFITGQVIHVDGGRIATA